jgi:flavin reductase (DIM6/NTAB) family NADH-FMN oxidoreductase RutF
MTVTPERFREAMRQFATGITIVTTVDQQGEPYGVTVNSFTSVSLDPLLVLICLDNGLTGFESFRLAPFFGVNILAEGQQYLSEYFATRGTDRTHIPYSYGKTGVPLLADSLASLECEVTDKHPGGDHTIFVGRVVDIEIPKHSVKRGPLIFFGGRYRRIGEETGRLTPVIDDPTRKSGR